MVLLRAKQCGNWNSIATSKEASLKLGKERWGKALGLFVAASTSGATPKFKVRSRKAVPRPNAKNRPQSRPF